MSDNGSVPPEQKPKPEAADAALNIKIVNTNGDEVFFKIKKTTKLNKLKRGADKRVQNAYAERVGTDVGSIRLLFEGQRIQDHQTALDLDLEDGDSLDVLLEQVGGY
ncbi:hypothetical protein IAT38_007891 [Cryptococcus sp. DSM 104549]